VTRLGRSGRMSPAMEQWKYQLGIP
jgi:hypothetical protein